MDIERGFVKTSKGHIHYRATGSGDCVMLFHINQQSSALYLELLQALGPRYRAIAIDYPSYGMSDHVDWQPTMEGYAELVIEVMDALGIAKSYLLGEAVGAMVATAVAALHPDRVEKIMLLNCPYIPLADRKDKPGGVDESMRPVDETGFPMTRTIEFVLEHDPLHAPLNPSQSWMDRINEAQILTGRSRWQAYDAVWTFDFGARLQALKCPVMVVIGEHFYFLKYKDELISKINDLHFEVLSGGRFCIGWEFSEEIGKKAIGFFAPRLQITG